MRQNWPERLWLVRHGQSQGNVARDKADAAGHSVIELDMRDVDVPLSDLGLRQAEAAKVLRVTQPRVSDLLRGRIDLFSTDALIDMVARLGVGVRLVVGPGKSKKVA